MAKRTIEIKADRGEFLTLDEVGCWLQATDAAGAKGDAVVSAAVSFGGKLQKVSVSVDAGVADRLAK